MSDVETKLSSETELADENYKPLSVGSIFVLLLGLASVVGIFSPYLLVIPVGTIILAAIVLIKIKRSKRPVSGIGFTSVGLSIALLAFTWALTQQLTRNHRLYTEANYCCNRWMALVEDGRLYEAFELTIPYEQRKLEGVDLERIYTATAEDTSMQEMLDRASDREEAGGALATAIPGTEKMAYEAFYGDEPRATMVAMARNGKLELLKNEYVLREGFKDEVSQQYRFVYKDENGQQQEVEVRFVLTRWKYPIKGEYHWNITKIERLREPSTLETLSQN